MLINFLLSFTSHGYAEEVVIGSVTYSVGEVSHPQGTQVRVGERLITAEGAQLHLQFIDQAKLVLRANSSLLIEAYRYDPTNPSNHRVKYRLESGMVRSLTGLAGEQNKSSFRLNTPLAAIGIRGTDFVVSTNDEQTRVAVISGAVSVSALNDVCMAAGFGACETSQQRVEAIANSVVNAVEVLKSNNQIQVNPSDWMPEAIRLLKRHDYSKDAPIEMSMDSFLAKKVIAEQQAIQSSDRVQINAYNVHWGRWKEVVSSDQSLLSAAQLLANQFLPVAANQTFGLFVAPNLAEVPLPITGQVALSPAQAQVYYRIDNQLTAGVLDKATLDIDFAQHTFNTTLAVKQHNSAAADLLTAAGRIYSNGVFSSQPQFSNSQVSGMVVNGGNNVGMLFEQHKTDSSSSITGGIWWQKP
ncbi:MAG TPA: FecR family protein [Thiotrichales bacterium]|nr:FecR family protein [Thiotrichales bacterium]